MTNSINAVSAHAGGTDFYWRVVFKPHFLQSLVVLAVVFAGAALDIVIVGLTVPLLDTITRAAGIPTLDGSQFVIKAFGWLGVPSGSSAVIFTLLLVIVFLFVSRSILFVYGYCKIASIGMNIRNSTRSALLERFLNAQYAEIAKRGRGAILRDITNSAEMIYLNIRSVGNMLVGGVTVIALTGLLMYFSWQMTLSMGLLSLGIMQFWKIIASRRSASYGHAIYELGRDQSKLEVDSVDGVKVVKSYALADVLRGRYEELLQSEVRPQLKLVFLGTAPLFINELTGGLAVLILGAFACFIPSAGVTFSLLGAFLLAVRKIGPGIAQVNTSLVEIRRSWRGLEVLDEILHSMPQESSRGRDSVGPIERIKMEGVSFAYSSNGTEILKSISFESHQGTVTAIVGPTGAGKSTIANLIMRFYEPREGKIFVNNTEIQNLDLLQWRKKIGYVSQDVFLFNATLRENLMLWDSGVTAQDVDKAVALSQMDEFVAKLPDGLDTVIGDRGLKLSGGQCQRLAIARAILRQPEILIFDEATSALDNLTERGIYRAIEKLRSRSIVIMISHRLSTIHQADRIIVLKEGRVVESGSSQELMKIKGFFWELNGSDEVQRVVS